MVNLDILLVGYSKFYIMISTDICYNHPYSLEPKLWWLILQFFKLWRDVLNICLVTLKKIFYILLIIMMYPMSSGLNGVEIKLNTTQAKIFQNDIKTRITPELLTEDGQCQELFILFLALEYSRKYRYNPLQPQTQLTRK